MSSFGERLRRLRNMTGRTQAEVAAEISERFPSNQISQTGLSALENRPTAPREAVLRILAEYYDVPTSYFLEPEKIKGEQNAQRKRALQYIAEVRAGRATITEQITAHSSRLRRSRDPIQKVLSRLDEQEE